MAWVAVDKDGAEKIFDVKPFRGNTQEDRNHVWGTYVGENYGKWYPKHDGRNEDTGRKRQYFRALSLQDRQERTRCQRNSLSLLRYSVPYDERGRSLRCDIQ